MALVSSLSSPQLPSSPREIRALQIGMWWGSNRAGGLDRVFANLVDHLPAYGVQVMGLVRGPENVSLNTNGRVNQLMEDRGGALERLMSLRRITQREITSFNPHVIGVHFALYAAMAGRRLYERPLVVHFHGPWSAEAAHEGATSATIAAKHLVERSVYRRAQKIIVLSASFRRLIIENYGVAEDHVCFVPGHVDLDRFAVSESKMEARQKLGWPLYIPILVAVRRLTQRMGLDELIDAMCLILPSNPEIHLYIAGTGRYETSLRAHVEVAGLAKHVHFLGFVSESELPLLYRAADLNVVPSQALEGFGLVAAEALAAGTPSMVSPIGGLPEVVEALAPGLIFETPEAESIADRIKSALNGSLQLPDATECRAHAAKSFNAELAVRRTAEVYRDVAAA